MKIALTQFDITWEDKPDNKKKATLLVQQASKEHAHLIVFPELTLTGFSMNANKIGELKGDSETVHFFSGLSKEYNIAVGFGYAEKTKDKLYNRFCIIEKGIVLANYAKIHPFTFGGEHEVYHGGTDIKGCEIDSIKLGMFICYDLRFPEVFLESSKDNQAIIVIANWPKQRKSHWLTLLKARAIENQCYMVGVNRIGEGNSLVYEESSILIDPLGNDVVLKQEGDLLFGHIDSSVVEKCRSDFPVSLDRRKDIYKHFYQE